MSFTKKLSVGNRTLDSEHRRLHEITNSIARSIIAGDTAVLPEAFRQLEHCLHSYFAVEEKIAHAVNFDFTLHRTAHENLWTKIQHIKNRLVASGHALPKHERSLLAGTLNEHLIQHIMVDCKPLKIVLDTHYYDLKPDGCTP